MTGAFGTDHKLRQEGSSVLGPSRPHYKYPLAIVVTLAMGGSERIARMEQYDRSQKTCFTEPTATIRVPKQMSNVCLPACPITKTVGRISLQVGDAQAGIVECIYEPEQLPALP